jgi:class 3 adenylate cyclase
LNQVRKTNGMQILPYKPIILLMRLLGIGTIIVIVIFLLPLAIPYINDARSFKGIRVALDIEKSVSSFIQGIIPTKIAGKDMTRWIVIIVAFLLNRLFSNLRERYRDKMTKLRVRRDYEELKKQMHLPDNAKVLTPLREKLEGLQSPHKGDREELLKLFAETKRKLDTMGRDLAFLSIDVVDSTGLKEGEEKATIEYDFKEYKRFVESKLTANGTLKSTWTPDGVMSCFPTVDAAVRAARDVIDGLKAFNKNVKTLKKDFRVRCGVNSGYVYFDESIPLEEISDRVIDIAGHLQKHASPNNICIAKPAIEPLQERAGFVPISKVVDGYEVYTWERGDVPRE